MKKKLKWSLLPLVIIFTVVILNQQTTVDGDDNSRKLSDWKVKVDHIEGSAKANRKIASISSEDPKRKSGRVMPYKVYKNQIKKKYNLAKESGFKYRSISPDQGVDFKNGLGNYKFLDHFYAIENSSENRRLYSNSTIKLGYIIVESDTPLDGLAIVENADTGRLGIFTGILKTKLQDLHDVDTLIDHNEYQVVIIHDHIQLVQYRIDNIALAIKTHKKLQSNPKVLRVTLEILEYQRTQL